VDNIIVGVKVDVSVMTVGSKIIGVGFSTVGFSLAGLPLSTIELSFTTASAVPVASTSTARAVCVATKLEGSTTKVHPLKNSNALVKIPIIINFRPFLVPFIGFISFDSLKDFELTTILQHYPVAVGATSLASFHV